MRTAALLVALTCVAAFADAPAPRYETRTVHDPDGIGKFHLGREIAQVMGPGGIVWLERSSREREEQPEKTIAALDVKAGQTIADLGAGSGYYSFRIAPLVGATGKVIAVDIEAQMLRAIRERAVRENVPNIATLRSSPTSSGLAPASVDLVFMVDVYHELEFPFETMQSVRAALKPGGRLAVIEYRQEDPAVAIKPVHKMSEQQIIRELTAAGFRHTGTVRTLPLQHLVWFAPG